MGNKTSEPTPKYRANVVTLFWRAVYGLKSVFEQRTINYTIEAESWNKAYSVALDDKRRIASTLGVDESDVEILSVTRIYTKDGGEDKQLQDAMGGKCKHIDEDGFCMLSSDDEVHEYCVEGPCHDYEEVNL